MAPVVVLTENVALPKDEATVRAAVTLLDAKSDPARNSASCRSTVAVVMDVAAAASGFVVVMDADATEEEDIAPARV